MKIEQKRNKAGKFTQKSNEKREVRTIRLTDTAWEKLGELATEEGITRADLVEEWIQNNRVLHGEKQQIIQVLEEALGLKANAGGAIKGKIKDVLKLLLLT